MGLRFATDMIGKLKERMSGWLAGHRDFIYTVLPKILAWGCLAVSAFFAARCSGQLKP